MPICKQPTDFHKVKIENNNSNGFIDLAMIFTLAIIVLLLLFFFKGRI